MTSSPGPDQTQAALTYGEYLQVDHLLTLQQPRSSGPEHDEMLFIVIHQVYELWFKELLHEVDRVRARLEADDAHRAQHTLKRVLTILKVMVAQLDILETMTPLEFLSFRERLEAASGFQSDQFRQLEFVIGLKSEPAINRFAEGSRARQALVRRFEEPTLWESYLSVLKASGQPVDDEKQVVAAIINVLQREGNDDLGVLSEQLIEFDEHFALWRNRHVQMVMRMIGAKPGTGQVSVAQLAEAGYSHMGTSGVDYLRSTLDRTFFPLLWEARTFVQR